MPMKRIEIVESSVGFYGSLAVCLLLLGVALLGQPKVQGAACIWRG